MSVGATLFLLCGLILLALSGLCVFEWYAIQFKGEPTISRIVAYSFATNPHLYMIGIFTTGVIFGALVTHFTNWRVK